MPLAYSKKMHFKIEKGNESLINVVLSKWIKELPRTSRSSLAVQAAWTGPRRPTRYTFLHNFSYFINIKT